MEMQQHKDRIDTLNSILDREIVKLDTMKLEHHKSWDANILTLSIAAIGFSLTGLPIVNDRSYWLLVIALVNFVLSIVSVLLSYLYLDSGLGHSYESNIIRRNLTTQVKSEFEALEQLIESHDADDHTALVEKFRQVSSEIFREKYTKNHEKAVDTVNKRIKFLNVSKTILFIVVVVK